MKGKIKRGKRDSEKEKCENVRVRKRKWKKRE